MSDITDLYSSSVVKALAAKAGGPGFDPRLLPWVVFSWLIVMHMDEGSVVLWYSLAAINTDMNGLKDLWFSSTVWLLSTQI